MTYKDKIKTLNELLKLVGENYFAPYFKSQENAFDGMPAYELKGIVKDFLECRIIELETDKEY